LGHRARSGVKNGREILNKNRIMETLEIHTGDKEQLKNVKAVLRALKVPIEASGESPYGPGFVAKIKESERQAKEGKVRTVKTEDLWK